VREQIKRDWRAVKLFRSLKDLGVKIGIATDGTTAEQIETLRKLDVLTRVDAIATSEMVGVLKPNRRVFDAVVGLLGVLPGETIHVGDNWERDVEGARRCGMLPVYVVRKPTARRTRAGVPIVELGDLQAVLGLLPRPSLPTGSQ
jgi:putative hydrolase of the HAD superfamily